MSMVLIQELLHDVQFVHWHGSKRPCLNTYIVFRVTVVNPTSEYLIQAFIKHYTLVVTYSSSIWQFWHSFLYYFTLDY